MYLSGKKGCRGVCVYIDVLGHVKEYVIAYLSGTKGRGMCVHV